MTSHVLTLNCEKKKKKSKKKKKKKKKTYFFNQETHIFLEILSIDYSWSKGIIDAITVSLRVDLFTYFSGLICMYFTLMKVELARLCLG